MWVEQTELGYTVELTGREVAALAAHVTKDECRQNLFGVHIYHSETSVRIATTDGHRLCEAKIVSVESLGNFSDTFLRCDLRSLAKHTGKRGTLSLRVIGDGQAKAFATNAKGITVESVLESGKPVPIDDVMPKDTTPTPPNFIGINPCYMADLVLILDAVKTNIPHMKIAFKTALDPVLFTPPMPSDDGTEWRVVIMPCRLK